MPRTCGDDEGEALLQAVDALETALEFYLDARKRIPEPSPAQGRKTVAPTPLSCAKLSVYQAMMDQGLTRSELARRLNWHFPQVERLLNLRHASRLEQLETALAALGKRLSISVLDAA